MESLHLAFAVGAVAGLAHLTGVLTSILTDNRYWPPGERDWRFYATWTLSNVLNVAILAVAALDWESLPLPLPARVAGGVLFVAGYAVAIQGGRDLGFEQTLGLEGDLQADGLYRYSRHPQYVGYVVATVGGMLIPASRWVVPLLGIYLLWWLALPLAEEPWLVEQFGDDYERYRERVPRFVGLRSLDPLPAGTTETAGATEE
jgi:protein-S-isoprenylcysteine O-methyltransferase Ste14